MGAAEVSDMTVTRARRDPASASPCTRIALDRPVRLGQAADGVRQLDERPVPRRRPGGLHPPSLRRHGRHAAAHVPGPHEALQAPGRAGPRSSVAAERLDGRVGREPAIRSARRPPARGAGGGPLHLRRAPARAARASTSTGSTGSSPAASPVRGTAGRAEWVARAAGPLPGGRGRVLLQAVGWSYAEGQWPLAGRPDVGRQARAVGLSDSGRARLAAARARPPEPSHTTQPIDERARPRHARRIHHQLVGEGLAERAAWRRSRAWP